jgi:hypothetical protein
MQKIRGSSVVLGALFVVIAVSALLGRFDDAERAKAVLPVAVIVVGVTAIASGIRTLLSR